MFDLTIDSLLVAEIYHFLFMMLRLLGWVLVRCLKAKVFIDYSCRKLRVVFCLWFGRLLKLTSELILLTFAQPSQRVTTRFLKLVNFVLLFIYQIKRASV